MCQLQSPNFSHHRFSPLLLLLLLLSHFSHVRLYDPIDGSPPGSPIPGILQARIVDCVAMPSSRRFSQPRDQTKVSCMQMDSLPSEPPGKPENTGVGSLSFLQGIFLTQGSNPGLSRCRWTLPPEPSGKSFSSQAYC